MKIVKHLQNGKIGIYKRGTNNTYHARFKVDNKWIKKSCKTQDLDEAIAFCENKYQEYMYRLKFHLPIETKLFKDVAELVIKDLQSSLDSGYGKVSYKDYISVLRRYYIPFFGKKIYRQHLAERTR